VLYRTTTGQVEFAADGDPLSAGRPIVPAFIEAREKVLAWSHIHPETGAVWGDSAPEGMLSRFLTIRSDADVRRFAERYGPLALCKHGEPASHKPIEIYGARGCTPLGEQGEPYARWHFYVRLALAIAAVATALHSGVAAPVTDARAVADWLHPDATRYLKTDQAKGAARKGLDLAALRDAVGQTQSDSLAAAMVRDSALSRNVVARAVNKWLVDGDVRPAITWQQPQPQFRFTGWTFGILGVQLLAAVAQGRGWLFCDGCGSTYKRENRMPRRGLRNYCPACREQGVPDRDRKRVKRDLERRTKGARS
jgi:hypothetical protein